MAQYVLRGAFLSALMAVAALPTLAPTALANDKEVVNPSCKLVAEAQCGWGELRGVDAAGMDLRDGQFHAARFDEANLAGANISGSHLQLTNFFKANLKGANLENSHMHGVNLIDANLEGANLNGVNFLDAVLTGANLKGAKIDRVIWIAANLSGATWVDGRVCAEGSKGECK